MKPMSGNDINILEFWSLQSWDQYTMKCCCSFPLKIPPLPTPGISRRYVYDDLTTDMKIFNELSIDVWRSSRVDSCQYANIIWQGVELVTQFCLSRTREVICSI